MQNFSELEQRYQNTTIRIHTVVKQNSDVNKPIQIPQLLAVSKKRSAEEIDYLASLGHQDFAENYVQEAVSKIETIGKSLTWHFIGPIQSNKTSLIAEYFSWVQTIDREKIISRLAAQRPSNKPPLNLCIQINIDQSPTKSGLPPNLEAISKLGETIQQHQNLKWRGLMCIPDRDPNDNTGVGLQEKFAHMATLFKTLKHKFPDLDCLSMGMSQDFHWAIAAGATQIRIGTEIFGSRGS